MADDRGLPPTPRPRRRRTDIDPNAPSPPVANERRRSRKAAAAGAPSIPETAVALAAISRVVPTPPSESPGDATSFHVPGLAAAALIDQDGAAVGATPADVPTDDRRSWLQVLDDRSPDPNVCPFLRATGQNGLVAPIETPDTTNRCAALAEAVPQSLRQQELVCLSTGHVNCPRYLRGAAVIAETPTPVVREGRAMSPAMLGSLVVLVLALSASVGFVLARGGALDIAPPGVAASASPSSVAAASPSAASGAPVVAPTSSSLGPGHALSDRLVDPLGHPVADAVSDTDTDGRADPARDAEVRPVSTAAGLPEYAALLDLHRPTWRQPVQHRALLRRVPGQHLCTEPVAAQPGPEVRPAAAATAAHALRSDPEEAR